MHKFYRSRTFNRQLILFSDATLVNRYGQIPLQIATANGHTAVEKELRKFLKVRKSRDTAGGTTLLS